MAVTNQMYGLFYNSLATKQVNWTADAIKALLVTSAYTFNQDTHQYKDVSVTNELATGGGYTAGGILVPSPTLAYDSVNHRVNFKGNGISWANASLTARAAIVYDDTPATNKPLVCYINFGQDLNPVNGTLGITWDANGLCYVGVS